MISVPNLHRNYVEKHFTIHIIHIKDMVDYF